jgi:hypothetical protein
MADNFANPTPAVTPSMGNNDIYKIQIDNASSSRAPSQPAAFALQDKLAQTVKSINDIVAGFDEFNILEYYHWTLSQNKSNITPFIPKLIATEYDIVTTPVVQNLKYTLSVLAGTAGTTSDAVNKFLGDDPKWKNVFDTQTVNDLKDNIEKFGNKARDFANDLARNNEMDFENNMELREKYKHLYTVKRTGKRFIFPYLEENFLSLANDFSETNEYLTFGSFNTSDMSKTLLKSLTQLPSLLSPGAYIQAPKFYDFGKVGEPSVTIHFPLYNTINSYHTERNIKFVKIFGLNNMPYRRSMLQVDPSRIYSVKIPGKAFFPFCYVSSYDVKHVGNKSLFINDIYPEAYNISITFTSLIKYDVNMFKDEMKMNADYDTPTRRPTDTIYDERGNTPTKKAVTIFDENGNPLYSTPGTNVTNNDSIDSDVVEESDSDQIKEAGLDINNNVNNAASEPDVSDTGTQNYNSKSIVPPKPGQSLNIIVEGKPVYSTGGNESEQAKIIFNTYNAEDAALLDVSRGEERPYQAMAFGFKSSMLNPSTSDESSFNQQATSESQPAGNTAWKKYNTEDTAFLQNQNDLSEIQKRVKNITNSN